MKTYLLGIHLFLVSAATAMGQTPQVTRQAEWGTVEGVVLDDDGNRLPGATITSYTNAPGSSREVMQYQANAKGEFSLRLPEGSVWLTAHKKSEGYPYAFFAFYLTPGQEFPTIKVKPGETTKGIVVRVGLKAAHLSYEVVDENGKPIPGRFVFLRVDQADRPYTTSALSKDDLLVPPVPFRATFEAKGYKPWHYGGENWRGRDGIISLKSGAILDLTIHLQRTE
jgi:hypothetical protein